MKILRIPFTEVDQLSKRDVAYQMAESVLEPFYEHPVEIEQFTKVIEKKSTQKIDRTLLVNVLRSQYKAIEASAATLSNITALAEDNCFSIVTAHQPSLLTGPLYYIYKICSTIHLVHLLRNQYPDYKFVPVFISGGEDHDFEEINHLHLFNKKIEWSRDTQSSPVGRLSLEGIEACIREALEILGDSSPARYILEEALTFVPKSEQYSEFVKQFVNQLFAEHGLVILSMDEPDLKRIFSPVVHDDIFKNSSKALVLAEQEKLNAVGFDHQAHAREINFFYITEENSRCRIERDGENFKILNTELIFSKEQMETLIESHPERFSPNVIMRPLYQEMLLPNLAYIGGGGELAYWMERRKQFQFFNLPFPMLIRRNSVLLLDNSVLRNLNKLNLEIRDLFNREDLLINRYIESEAGSEFDLQEFHEKINTVFDTLKSKTESIDASLLQRVDVERTKVHKSLEQIAAKLKKSLKQKEEVNISRIRKIYGVCFPGGSLQERTTNFLELLHKSSNVPIIDLLVENLNPLQKEFLVIDPND